MRLRRTEPRVYASESLFSDLTPFDLARAARVPIAMAHDWLAGQGPAGGALERLRALAAIVDSLQALGLEAPEDRAEWLRRPNRAFGRQAPLDLISLDESRRVRDYVATLS